MISRAAPLEAYEQLIAEGFLDAKQRAGTRVASAFAQSQFATSGRQKPAANATPPSLPAPAVALAKIAEQFQPLPQAPFAVSVPIGPAAPDETWRRLGNRIRGPGAPSGYDDPQGIKALLEAVAEYVRRSRSVQCDAEQVIITTGTQQGLYLACQVLLGATDIAWVEDPAYRGITGILDSIGRQDRIVRVPVDDARIDVEAGMGMAKAKDARAAFVTSSHQYPLGMPMSMGRRNALLAWARKNSGWTVEDGYDSELRYAGHPFPSLQGRVSMLARAAMVIRYLPSSKPASTLSYGKLVGSLWNLIHELREAALTGAALFAAFSLFWSVLSLLLVRMPFNLGPQATGLFGIVGAAGEITAPWAGKFADRRGPRAAISLAIGLIALSFVVFGFSGATGWPCDRRHRTGRRLTDRTNTKPVTYFCAQTRGTRATEYRLYGVLFRRRCAGLGSRLISVADMGLDRRMHHGNNVLCHCSGESFQGIFACALIVFIDGKK